MAMGSTSKMHVTMHIRLADDIISKRKRLIKGNPTQNNKKYVGFLDILLLAKDDKGQGLTGEEIRHEVDTFLFGGHDTTASAISWIIYALAKHPEIQEKCRNEIKATLENEDTHDMIWDSLVQLPYLTQCVKEGLRMYSPVPYVMRQLTMPLELDGHIIPTNTVVGIPISSVHHNEVVWGEDHDEFKPERFHPDNIQKMDSHAFIPFSAGPRNCIGQNFAMHEIKVIVARVLQHFELSVDEKHLVERLTLMVMRAKNGIKLKLKPLN